MATFGFFHNALGKTDGVSLEVDKWKVSLEKMGHVVKYFAGNDDSDQVICIPELSFVHPLSYKLIQNATVELKDYDEQSLITEIMSFKEVIKSKILDAIKEHSVTVLVPNNLMSLGFHIPALIALYEIIEEKNIPSICHNHDFYFENGREAKLTCPAVKKLLEKYAPPPFSHVKNLTINRLAQAELRKRKGIDSTVVPNIFDFEANYWIKDEYNADFRTALGIHENDIVFLQATRVMNRKGIELAIDVIAELNSGLLRSKLEQQPLYDGRTFTPENNIILLCVGYIEEFGATADYHENLKKRAKKKGVDLRFVGDKVKHSRSMENGNKIYSLWDSYMYADFVTYPSIWEGWGNQFIEAISARLPILLFEYAVYLSDLKADGFSVVSLGETLSGKDEFELVTVDDVVTQRAASQVAELLQSQEKRELMVHHNYEIAKSKYSFKNLDEIISILLIKLNIEGNTDNNVNTVKTYTQPVMNALWLEKK